MGVDEAGCGALAGPVVAAAVVACGDFPDGLDDSKRLSPARRERLYRDIAQGGASFAIALATPREIDQMNILQARLLAMQRAVERLGLGAGFEALVDGNRLPRLRQRARAIVGGDGSVPAISAASVMAKVYRDRLMKAMHSDYPEYGFAGHKGYPTRKHLRALREYGLCPEHRASFGPCRALQASLGAGLAAT